MANLATWIRRRDKKYFAPFFAQHPEVMIWNAAEKTVPLERMDGLLLTGGLDIAAEFLNQEIADPSLIEADADPERDRWEFSAIDYSLGRGLPLLAICKGMQTLNVALGGTLHLDIAGHNVPKQKRQDVQPLRSQRGVRHRFEKVNSSHHQAIDKLGDRLVVESWCATDGIIEQVRVRDYPFGLAVQYHPERGKIYDALFHDFFGRLKARG